MHGRYKNKSYKENQKRGYKGEIEDTYWVKKLQRTRGPIQCNEQINGQVGVTEAPNNMQ